MSSPDAGPPWQRVLVLGGIRSGKSEFAEALMAGADRVRYVATGRRGAGDGEWEARIDAHQARRPGHWALTEVGDHRDALPDLLRTAGPEENLLVDDVGGWIGTVMDANTSEAPSAVADQLATAVDACPARLVLVSPEVGLSLVPPTSAGRAFADLLGSANRTVAAVCDVVVLVIAGNAVPVKGRL